MHTKIERIAKEQADPIAACQDGWKDKLGEIEVDKEREKGIDMNIKRIRPFDRLICCVCMARMRKEAVADSPKKSGDTDANQEEVNKDHMEDGLDDFEEGVVCIYRAPE
jgi:hypothetical protein